MLKPLTFVIYAENRPDLLARTVLLPHRLAIPIEGLVMQRPERSARMCFTLDVLPPDQSESVAENLARIVHVVWVQTRKEFPSPETRRSIQSAPELLMIVYLITTGGTIEKVYSERTGEVANLSNKIDRYLRQLRLPDMDVNVVPLMNKDSLEMTDHDRILLLGMVRAILKENAPIVITHGTDTMVQSGLFLDRALSDLHVPIAMTGAMTPLGFEGTDGLQNLTESLFAVRLLKPGIYVVMHGQHFPIAHVRKDKVLGRFVWSERGPL